MLFIQDGSYFVAFVIFTASVLIPLMKMLAIAWLCYCCKSNARFSAKELTNMYRLVEFIGKWSMIDVFVVALLVALVQLSGFNEYRTRNRVKSICFSCSFDNVVSTSI